MEDNIASQEYYELITSKLGKLHKKVRQKQSSVLEKYNISLIEYHIIVIIKDLKSVSQNDIAKILNVNKAFISRQIKSMQKKELLFCDNNPDCRRANTISLSDRALELLPELKKVHEKCLEDIFYDLEETKICELNNILERLINKL